MLPSNCPTGVPSSLLRMPFAAPTHRTESPCPPSSTDGVVVTQPHRTATTGPTGKAPLPGRSNCFNSPIPRAGQSNGSSSGWSVNDRERDEQTPPPIRVPVPLTSAMPTPKHHRDPTSASHIVPSDQSSTVRLTSDSANVHQVPARDGTIAKRFRTEFCRNFTAKGRCPYDARCMYAHGERQLRTQEMNLRDGITSEEAIREFKMKSMPGRRWTPREVAALGTSSPKHRMQSRQKSKPTVDHDDRVRISTPIPIPRLAEDSGADDTSGTPDVVDSLSLQRRLPFSHNPYSWEALGEM